MKTIRFDLNIDEANLVFRALSRMPFGEVYELIGKLNNQANLQLDSRDASYISVQGPSANGQPFDGATKNEQHS